MWVVLLACALQPVQILGTVASKDAFLLQGVTLIQVLVVNLRARALAIDWLTMVLAAVSILSRRQYRTKRCQC